MQLCLLNSCTKVGVHLKHHDYHQADIGTTSIIIDHEDLDYIIINIHIDNGSFT